MAQRRRRLSLFLTDPRNDFVGAIAKAAEDAALHHDVALTLSFTQNQAVEQIQQIYGALRAIPPDRPDAVLVMPVHDSSLERVAHTAAAAGVGWICLHRATGDLAAIRREFPDVPVALVAPSSRRSEGSRAASSWPSFRAAGASSTYTDAATTSPPPSAPRACTR